ncbi:MAG: DNA-formamidopyrimidine glycosylase [Candidatus Yanofskybacteria bacterium RIFCSPHIGHO2_02_FULL_41_11]|uniref:DNA-formamidopyrimidine glycosylase n=1 Tax=Candidatus Yanofskybacteria bacterium RIFCSPHIGHO2_02_FULL_41_11 TaxID=1802675 RepID=A0A1F8F9W8_9BACT|nr:MAG: DNA-formamidopyrimidine glycosylase [Candidatus Yanofskybacteria bacterium RIFCSPHIGHO2_02_FULL_41_11]
MPELPEVETTVSDLRKKLIGLRFKDVWTDPAKPTYVGRGASWPLIKKVVKNKKILDVRRRAKFIIIDIEGAYSIFIHQKISGHLLYGKWTMEHGIWKAKNSGPLKSERENGYIRTIWLLNNGYQLAFSDLRRFGKIVLVKDDNLSELPEIKKLGPEPLEISLEEFKELFYSGQTTIKKRGRIKQVLMDPFFIAGIGNIYSDEILWSAGYHPLSRAENLSGTDLKKIFNSTIKILKKAIKLGGSSVEDYRMPSGEKGGYQNQTKAYQREGEKCSRKDGGVIERIKLGGRSAHFCPKHQKIK